MQFEGEDSVPPTHWNVGLGPEQFLLQLLKGYTFPSSHVSGGLTFPSPHTIFNLQTEGVPIHLKLGSIIHYKLHPSPDFKFPSSHVSGLMITPSPQVGPQIES